MKTMIKMLSLAFCFVVCLCLIPSAYSDNYTMPSQVSAYDADEIVYSAIADPSVQSDYPFLSDDLVLQWENDPDATKYTYSIIFYKESTQLLSSGSTISNWLKNGSVSSYDFSDIINGLLIEYNHINEEIKIQIRLGASYSNTVQYCLNATIDSLPQPSNLVLSNDLILQWDYIPNVDYYLYSYELYRGNTRLIQGASSIYNWSENESIASYDFSEIIIETMIRHNYVNEEITIKFQLTASGTTIYNGREYTIRSPRSDYSNEIKYAHVLHNVTVNASTNGSVKANKSTATLGETVTLTITPNTGYELDTLSIKRGSTNVAVTNNIFKMPASDVTVRATFKKIVYNVTVNASTNGSVKADKSTATIGDTVSLTITPNTGYELDTLSVKQGSTTVPVSNNQFTMPAGSVTVTATFKKSLYSVTVNPSNNGNVTTNPNTATMGDTIFLSLVPDIGYELDAVIVKQGEIDVPVTNNQFTMPAGNVTVSASFKKIIYSVLINASENGSVAADKSTATIGDTVALTVTPDTGYELDSLSVKQGNTDVSVSNNQFTMPAGNVTVSASFKKIIYSVTVNASEKGDVKANPNYATMGDKVTLTITPAANYELDTLSVKQSNSELTVTDNSFTMPAGNVTVTASFKKIIIGSGTWGRINWELNNKGLLTISGSGNMVNLSQYGQDAWRAYSSNIQKVVIKEGVTGIGNYAFYTCSNITDFSIPSSVTGIGSYAFSGCSSIIDIAIPSTVTNINSYAFSNCQALTSIVIPLSITSISSGTFQNCSSLTTVTIPSDVTEIESYSFSGCNSIKSMTIPLNVTHIGFRAFQGCTSLTDVYYEGTNDQWREIVIEAENDFLTYSDIHSNTVYAISFDANGGSNAPISQIKTNSQPLTLTIAVPVRQGWHFLGWSENATADDPEYLPGGNFTKDADTTLYAVWGQPDIVFPDALTTIDENAFENCSFRFAALSANTVDIRANAFLNCQNLKYILIPADNATINKDAFVGTENITILGTFGSSAERFATQWGFYFVPTQ